ITITQRITARDGIQTLISSGAEVRCLQLLNGYSTRRLERISMPLLCERIGEDRRNSAVNRNKRFFHFTVIFIFIEL
ncbi:MAG: hypothetical protein WA810_08500, partial [Maribacter sp.]